MNLAHIFSVIQSFLGDIASEYCYHFYCSVVGRSEAMHCAQTAQRIKMILEGRRQRSMVLKFSDNRPKGRGSIWGKLKKKSSYAKTGGPYSLVTIGPGNRPMQMK